MRKEERFPSTVFSADIIEEAVGVWKKSVGEDVSIEPAIRTVERGTEKWKYDNDDEFFADYRTTFSNATYDLGDPNVGFVVRVYHLEFCSFACNAVVIG
jgi:hypothetical protein